MKVKYDKCINCGQNDYKITKEEIHCNYCGTVYVNPEKVEKKRIEYVNLGMGTCVASTVAINAYAGRIREY